MNLTRRRFLAWSMLAAALQQHKLLSQAGELMESPDSPWLFLTSEEAEFVAAVADILIPADSHSPSATEAGVVIYIDLQLYGPYGAGHYQYTQGPFHAGTREQGYQLNMVPRQIYRTGIAAVSDFITKEYKFECAADLAVPELTAVVEAMEPGQLDGADSPVSAFFKELHGNVIEGYFSDPIYGGNRKMAGWKLLGFPGVDAYYAEDIETDGMLYTRAPTGLKKS